MLKSLMMLFLIMPLAGCYYLQAASGQWEVIRKREPIEEVIQDEDTSPELAARLSLLIDARDFSVEDLGLPDNNSYRTYAELERDYVVWNVFAAPEFSLQPKEWCFPVAGCVSYRGYFAFEDAQKESRRLADDGYDVAVGGVAAYSTLGNFSDPILSTMMHWDDIDLVALLFHELAHQVVYVKGDTAYNESFATAVEEIGVQRWLESRGEQKKMSDYMAGRDRQQTLLSLITAARADLQDIFDAEINDDERRAKKQQRLALLSDEIALQRQANGNGGSGWFSGELNNARLISTTLYEGWLPSFRALYSRCEQRLQCLYKEAERLADLDVSEREAELSAGDLLRYGSRFDE
jgi:predicted aminopeptidase